MHFLYTNKDAGPFCCKVSSAVSFVSPLKNVVLFISGPQYSARKKHVHTKLNVVSGSGMLAIWLKRKNRVVCSVELEGLLKARWSVERACYMMADNVSGFCKIWIVGTSVVLCSVGENGELTVSF